jgi:hypothetical protein
MNKVTYVPAYFKPLGRQVTVAVPTGERKRTFFGTAKEVKRKQKQWRQTRGWSNCQIDGERLAIDIAKAVHKLNADGYEVVSIVPAVSGAYNYRGVRDGWSGYGYGYGYSYTEGVIIVTRKFTKPS